MVVVLEILIFGYVLWLGLYLIAKDVQTLLLRYAGLGLLTYALMLGADVLPASDEMLLMRFGWPLPLWLSAFWFMATVELLPENSSLREKLSKQNRLIFLAMIAVLYGVSATTNLVFDYDSESPQWEGYVFFVLMVGVPLVISFASVVRSPLKTIKVVAVATLFLGLGLGALLLALDLLPRTIFLLSICLDLILFGVAIAFWDASEQGETLWPDMLRSFEAAFLIALVFGGQVALVMILSEEASLPLMTLLLSIISAAILMQVFYDPIQNWLDKTTFATPIQQAREELRTTARALPRVKDAVNFAEMNEAEFIRLTRRALGNMGNLPRLATNPLTQLPIIEQRLQNRGADMDTLERAAELKLLLTESIERLKPRGKDDFGTTDEWRYYNAVYFPYVAGIKPYSRRLDSNGGEPHIKAALDWFQAQVPERTLYNWQNAAAQLIAQDLRERTWQ